MESQSIFSTIGWWLRTNGYSIIIQTMAKKIEQDGKMEKVISLCKRRGFIFPGSEIYGGLQNSWDYGPLGIELKNNIKQEWWEWFVRRRMDMVGIDPAIIMNPKVWEASGHLKEFTDPMVECKKCHARFRADTLLTGGATESFPMDFERWDDKKKEEFAAEYFPKCLSCGAKNWTAPRMFNLLFKTFLGSIEEKANEVYLRGELAQAMFVNFQNVIQTTRRRLPLGIASQGKVFRNEITPGNFIFRTREFDLMEFEYFVKEDDWQKWFEYWLEEMKDWLNHLGIKENHIYCDEIGDGNRAHYSKRTVDINYDYPFGEKELIAIAYRGDFDLKNHMEKSGEDLRYTDPETQEKFLPHVIEPTFGLDRLLLVSMLEAYTEEQAPTSEEGETDMRVVMKFPYWLSPIKVAILPLSKKEELSKIARPLYEELIKSFVCEYDETQSIGKRYRRQDEIGTPFCVTVDFETLNDNSVTVRERDSMRQKRVKIGELTTYLYDKLRQ